MRRILTFEFVQNNNNARNGFTSAKKKRDGLKSAKKSGGIILRLLKGRGTDGFGAFRKETRCHSAPPQALIVMTDQVD
jgi:hypothetical protein